MKKIVMKFGGTSIASGENIRHVANLLSNYVGQGYRVVAVVSALGKVTDKLTEVAEQAKKGNRDYLNEFKQKLLKEHITAARKAIENKGIREEMEQMQPANWSSWRIG